MPGLSPVGGPPGFMMIHELDSLTMHGFSSRTTVPPKTREEKSRDRATLRTVMNNVTRMPSAGVGRLAKSMRGAGSVMGAPFGGVAPRRPAGGDLVPRTRSSHHTCRESGCELRVQSGTRIIELLVPFDSEVRKRACRKMMRTSESGH